MACAPSARTRPVPGNSVRTSVLREHLACRWTRNTSPYSSLPLCLLAGEPGLPSQELFSVMTDRGAVTCLTGPCDRAARRGVLAHTLWLSKAKLNTSAVLLQVGLQKVCGCLQKFRKDSA